MDELKINYKFSDPKLFKLALTHKSFSNSENNERLEFLGDAILDLVVTDFIYSSYPDLPEGELAKLRADIVCSPSLVKVADKMGLATVIDLGKGENPKSSILANALEALIAAIYLDGGYEIINDLILEWFDEQIYEAAESPGMGNYKSRLQELSAKLFDEAPEYKIVSDGPDHDKFFYARVEIVGKEWGKGIGHTKKEATQIAAKEAFSVLVKQA